MQTPTRDELQEDIQDLLTKRLGNTPGFPGDPFSVDSLAAVAARWAWDMTSIDPGVPEIITRALVRTLYPDDRVPLELWSRPVGRFILANLGYHHELVPLSVVAVMLGYSRQAIYQMANRGVLARRKDEGMWFITAASLRQFYQERGPKKT